MKKIITLCSFISLLIFNQSASALSFGEIKVYSGFAEPFHAEITVPSYSKEELKNIKIQLASQEEFARRGIERPEILENFNFHIYQNDDKNPAVFVASQEPVKELSVGLLIEVTWPKGSLIKAYNVLLTPEAISKIKTQSVIAQALKENSKLTIADALLSLITKRIGSSALQILSLEEITHNLRNEWQALTRHSSTNKNLPLLQANTNNALITQEEIESKKLELEDVRQFAAELSSHNEVLREQIQIMEEELLLSTKHIFNNADDEIQGQDDVIFSTTEDLSTRNSGISLDNLASMQDKKEILIAALLFLVLLLIVIKKKDYFMQKIQVRKNRKADAEAEF